MEIKENSCYFFFCCCCSRCNLRRSNISSFISLVTSILNLSERPIPLYLPSVLGRPDGLYLRLPLNTSNVVKRISQQLAKDPKQRKHLPPKYEYETSSQMRQRVLRTFTIPPPLVQKVVQHVVEVLKHFAQLAKGVWDLAQKIIVFGVTVFNLPISVRSTGF